MADSVALILEQGFSTHLHLLTTWGGTVHPITHHTLRLRCTVYSTLYSTVYNFYILHILVCTTLQQDLFSVLFWSYFFIVVAGLPLPPEIAQTTPFWVTTPSLTTPVLEGYLQRHAVSDGTVAFHSSTVAILSVVETWRLCYCSFLLYYTYLLSFYYNKRLIDKRNILARFIDLQMPDSCQSTLNWNIVKNT